MATPAQQVTAASAHPDPLAVLPPGYAVRTFSHISRLRKDANDVLTTLEANGGQGNHLGVSYLLQWDGCVGIMKIIPGFAHHVTTRKVATIVLEQLLAMGIPLDDMDWGGNTTYKPQARTGTQADNILPQAPGDQGKEGSLEADAKWWFANSSGDVRIVLLIVLNTTYVRFEKWQLVPPNAPRPVTQAYIDQLRANPAHNPPTDRQPPGNQYAYAAHEVTVTATTVTGAPMTLPFAALYERPPGPNEGDVVITSQMFREIVHSVF
ncbi:hypothetical protein CDV55_106213 [Aspergillus turcosus]|uniref:Uncharacterized protein n=1 Tax=Aspergillus turcosus TaxID=1245748 RepID=A0A229YYU8_9EURO|nr:hypothetical protein CDV55_106213 [Aspergillus turcosus]RLL98006.1 hypothetical protein CFD26_107191 [Aspergillus turcosus]